MFYRLVDQAVHLPPVLTRELTGGTEILTSK